MLIPFNRPLLTGKELTYIEQAVSYGKISGDGYFTNLCEQFFEKKYGFSKCLLTASCTDALEMCALLLDILPGDEVIMPTYTFVSMANAFYMRGAKLIFADSRPDHPGIDEQKIETLITPKTKAILVMHYGGVACDMDVIRTLADKYNLAVVEDAAHAVDSYYKDKPLGSFGDLATFSFHETKNITCGEGGMLVINRKDLCERAEIIREKGTNRKQFINGRVDKYNWVDIGSSYLMSDINAAYLYAQLEEIENIQAKRMKIWDQYYENLKSIKDKIGLPYVPDYATNNAHLFYMVCQSKTERDDLIEHLRSKNIYAVFHYQNLHQSPFFSSLYHGKELPNAQVYNDCLLRLPLFFDLTETDLDYISKAVISFFK